MSITKLPSGGIRAVVPLTPAVRAYRRRVVAWRWANVGVMNAVFVAATLLAWPQSTAFFCFGPIALMLLIPSYWAITHPNLISPFRADDATIEACEQMLLVSFSKEAGPIELTREEIRNVRAERCDFSRCWRVVAVGRRQRSPFRLTLVVHTDADRSKDLARALRDAIGLPER